MLNSLPRQCRVRVSCIIFHGHSFLCPARTYRLWPPPLHETKIPLHRTTVVKMISPASRDAGRPPSYSYPLFLPAETPRFIGWIPPRIGKLLADPGSDLIVINRYYCSGRRQHFYARSFGLMCRAIIQTESSRIDRVFLDQKIHRSLGFFFEMKKYCRKFIYRLGAFIIHRWLLHVLVTSNHGSFVPRMFTDPNSMKYLREERALIGRNRCLAGIIIGSLHRLELILPDESRGLVKWREISSKLSRSREISRQKRYIHRDQGNQTDAAFRTQSRTLVSPFLHKRIKLYSREIL